MNACRLAFEVSGQTSSPAVPVSGLTVHGTVAHPYQQVEVSVRTVTGGPPLFHGTATVEFPSLSDPDPTAPANDGAWHVAFQPGLLSLPCGLSLHVDARATGEGAPACSDSGWRTLRCKGLPGSGGTGGNGEGEDGDGGGGGWQWPDPPHIACPRWGRTFTATLMAGVSMLVAGLVLGLTALAAAGFAVILVAAGLYAFWRNWCVPSPCILLGALIWVMKRATILGAGLSLVTMNAAGLLPTLAAGAVTGALVAEARSRRCKLPNASTPLQQLPMW